MKKRRLTLEKEVLASNMMEEKDPAAGTSWPCVGATIASIASVLGIIESIKELFMDDGGGGGGGGGGTNGGGSTDPAHCVGGTCTCNTDCGDCVTVCCNSYSPEHC